MKKNNKVLYIVLIVVLVVAWYYWTAPAGPLDTPVTVDQSATRTVSLPAKTPAVTASAPVSASVLAPAKSAMDASYLLGGKVIDLALGASANPAASVVGVPVYGNIGAGNKSAVLIVRVAAGAKSNYYVAAAYVKNGLYQGTNGIYIGTDLVRPTINLNNNAATIGYRITAGMKAMTVKISGGKLIQL
jgi:hypothetical protein